MMENTSSDAPVYPQYPIPAVEEQEIISVQKFVLLIVITFGLYEFWWIYKTWRFFKRKDNLDVMPAMRAIFAIFFMGGLFERILNYAKWNGYEGDYSSAGFAAGFIICQLTSRLPDPYGYISLLSFLFLLTPFRVLNYAKQHDPALSTVEQRSFNNRQIVLLVVGGLLWLLVIAALILGLFDDSYEI